MRKRQGADPPAAGSGTLVTTSSSASAQNGSPAAQGAPGAAEARKLLATYAKGVRCADALQQLEVLHQRSPSHMTCLALAKVRVRQAVDAALKQDGGEDAREAAVLPLLTDALRFAVEGAAVHRSVNCLGLCDVLLCIVAGSRGARGRHDIFAQLSDALPSKKDAMAIQWVDPVAELVAHDRWPIEAAEGISAEIYLQRRLLPLRDRFNRCSTHEQMQAIKEEFGADRAMGVLAPDREHYALPAHVRLYRVAGLPDKLTEPLHRKLEPSQGKAEQERRRQHQEEEASKKEKDRVKQRVNMERKKRQTALQQLQQQVDKVRAFLLRRMAAAAGEEQGGANGEPRAAQLEALLRQTEVTPEQLKELLRRTPLPQEQQLQVQRSLGLAEQWQAVCFDLPRHSGEALAACATQAERKELSSGTLDAGRFAAALHQLVWGNPAFAAEGQTAAMQQLGEQLKKLDQAALSAQCGVEQLGGRARWDLPEREDLKVLAQCPGDMEVLRLRGAHAAGSPGGGLPLAALVAAAAATSAELERMLKERGSGPGSPADSPRAGAWSELDAVDDELPPLLGGPAAAAAAAPPGERPDTAALVAAEGQGGYKALAELHDRMTEHQHARFMLDLLILDEEEQGPLCRHVLAKRVQDPRSVAEQTDLHLRQSLLGLELLRLLERRSAAGASADAGPGIGCRPPTPDELAVHEHWEQLQSCWDAGSAEEAAQQLAESPEAADQMKQLLRALREQPASQPLVPIVLSASVLHLQLCLGAAAVGQAAASTSGGKQGASLAGYLAEVRRRLAHGVMAGLGTLASSRRLTETLLRTVCQFVHHSLLESRGSLGGESERWTSRVLAEVGRLPLRQLLQLHAFMALRMADNVVRPRDLDPELQELSLAACQQAERTQHGVIRLSESGLEAVGHEVALLEVLRAKTLGTATEAAEPDMADPAIAAEQLAGYCCGLPHLQTEVAVMGAGREASFVEQSMENTQGHEANSCVLALQRIAYVQRALAMVSAALSPAAKRGEEKFGLLMRLLQALKQLEGENGGVLVDAQVRSQLSALLYQLSDRLPQVAEEVCKAAALLGPLERNLKATVVGFENSVVTGHHQRLTAEQRAGNKAADEQLKTSMKALEELGQSRQVLDMHDLLPRLIGSENVKESAPKSQTMVKHAAQHLEAPFSGGTNMFDQAAVLGGMLEEFLRDLGRAMQPLGEALAMMRVLSDVALEQGRAQEGHLLCAHCMQPSLAPVFAALARHLLALKWQDDMAAEKAAELAAQEARRQALAEELMKEEEGGQDKDDKAREKRRAKKAAKKERRAAAADAAAQEAAAARAGGVVPMPLESVERRRQEEQDEGYRRMMQQWEQDGATPAEEQQAQQAQLAQQQGRQQGRQQQAAQQATRQAVQQAWQAQHGQRPSSASDFFDPAVLAGEEEEWATPLSSPMPEGLEASLEGLELGAHTPTAPASPRPQQAAAAATSAEPQPPVAPAEQQAQGSRSPEQLQQDQQLQEQQQEAEEAWETAASKRRSKRGAAGKPDAPQQQAAAVAAPRQGKLATPAASAQAGQQAAPRAGAPTPASQQQAGKGRPPAEPAAAAAKAQGSPPVEPQPAADAAPASPPAAAAHQEDDGWEEAPVQRRRGAKPAAAAAGRPQSGSAAPVQQYQRIINWAGDWICECGQRNAARNRCYSCNQMESPCREYCFLGGCSRGGGPPDGYCKFPHPPFELPSSLRPATKRGPHPFTKEPVDLIAEVGSDAGKPCMLPPPGVPLVAAHAPAAPPSGGSVRRAATAPQPSGAAAGRSPVKPHGLLSPSSSGRHLTNAVPPTGQLRGWGPAAVAHAAAGGAAAAAVSPRQRGPSQRSGGAWQPAPQSPTAAAAAAVGAPQEEDELAGLLDMMGIGDAAGTQPAAPAAGGWGEPASWAQHVGSQDLEGVEQAPGSWPAPGQDAEDAELEAAIQASLADAAAAASRQQAGAWQELPAAPSGGAGGAAAAAGAESESLALAGLRNEAGEYNCFLNVVVQCLWRCAEFRQQVAGWDAGFRARDPVLAALHSLFAQLEQQEAARSSAAAHSGGNGGRLPPVDPAPLREALAALPGQGFGLGEMNDAAELLLCMYEKVMEAEGASGRATELAATFGLAVREEVHCAACGKTTHQNAYTQYFYNTQATTLQLARLVAEAAASMGALLRDAEAQHRKSCDTDMRGCGALNSVNHFLQAAPRVFTLQVAWETHAPEPDVVAGTLAALDETVDLGEVYQGVDRGVHRYALRSMVCYYGQHYQALVLVPEAGGWLMFDDTRVTRVGSWADVRRKCEAGRIQPSVLFYEAA